MVAHNICHCILFTANLGTNVVKVAEIRLCS